MYDDGDSDYLFYRRKSCPCCRTAVRHRPPPAFILKSVVSVLAKGKSSSTAASSRHSSPPNEGDPWAGLFPPYNSDDSYHDAYDEGDDDNEEDELPRILYWGLSYGTILGNTFASMFPGRVGRMILDGVADANDYMKGVRIHSSI